MDNLFSPFHTSRVHCKNIGKWSCPCRLRYVRNTWAYMKTWGSATTHRCKATPKIPKTCCYVFRSWLRGAYRKHLSCSPHNCKASPSSTHLWSYRPPSGCLQMCGFSLGVGRWPRWHPQGCHHEKPPVDTTKTAGMYHWRVSRWNHVWKPVCVCG